MGRAGAIRPVLLIAALLVSMVGWGTVSASEESERIKIRKKAVADLAGSKSPEAADALHRVALRDKTVLVRVEAVHALADLDSERALPALVDLAHRGNVGEVRLAVASALGSREGAVDAIAKMIANRRSSISSKVLMVDAVADVDGAIPLLAQTMRNEAPVVAAEALRGIRRNADPAIAAGYAEMVLLTASAPDLVIAALDAFVGAGRAELELLEEKLKAHANAERASISVRAKFLLRRLAYLREMDARNEVRDTPYAKPGPDPEEPERRLRRAVDLVLSFDATFSERGGPIRYVRRRFRDHVDELSTAGTDLRVAVVAYRDILRDQNQRQTGWVLRVHPLTYDIDGVLDWMDEIRAGGIGEQGGAVEQALDEAYTRMVYRDRAKKRVSLVIAARMPWGELKPCVEMTRVLAKADGIQLQIYTTGSLDRDWLKVFGKVAGCDVEPL